MKKSRENHGLIKNKSLAEHAIVFGLQFISVLNRATKLILGDVRDSVILCYHSVSNDGWRYSTSISEFRNQMLEIKKSYKLVTLSAMLRGAKDPSVAVTFDDGYLDNLSVAAPILQNLKIPATLFMIGEAKHPNREELDNKKPLLNLSEVKKLKKMGWEIAFHTATHADLASISDEELYQEIVQGKKNLEKRLGFKLRYFAYPRGAYSPKIVNYVKEAGFEAAFTVDGGRYNIRHNKHLLARIGMEDVLTGKLFTASLSPLGVLYQQFYMSVLKFKACTFPKSSQM